MKNYILSIMLVLLTFTLLLPTQQVKAQTVGILIQPNFDSNSTAKGFFAEVPIYNRLGVYADYKFNNNTSYTINDPYRTEYSNKTDQLNVGLSYTLVYNVKAIASTSVINKQTELTVVNDTETNITASDRQHNNLYRTYQAGFIFNGGYISGLLAYETNKDFNNNRITVGVGVNF